MSLMHFNFFAMIRELRESFDAPVYVEGYFDTVEFPIHPSASELMEQMQVDPEALKNETYEPGIYDEDGDYYPQYSDDPSSLPEFIAPNPLDAGDTVPESSPASDPQPAETPVVPQPEKE